jgi:hypothetical protein
MRLFTLIVTLALPLTMNAQSTWKLKQLSIQLNGGPTLSTAAAQQRFEDAQFTRFPVQWSEVGSSQSVLGSMNSQTGGRLVAGFILPTKEASKLERYIDFGVSYTSFTGFSNARNNEQILSSTEEQTSAGTLRIDSVLWQTQSINHEAFMVGAYAQLRFVTKKDRLIKGSIAGKVFVGSTVTSRTSAYENEYVITDISLNDEPLTSSRLPNDEDLRGTFTSEADPNYFVTRASLPVGADIRLRSATASRSGWSLLAIYEPGLQYTTGTYGGLHPFWMVTAGLQFTFKNDN